MDAIRNYDHAFTKVESNEFIFNCGVVSSFKALTRYMRESAEMKELLALPDALELITKRICDLLKEPIDHRYQNPHDTPIAAYLWALVSLNLEKANTVAYWVLDIGHNFSWAKKMAKSIAGLDIEV